MAKKIADPTQPHNEFIGKRWYCKKTGTWEVEASDLDKIVQIRGGMPYEDDKQFFALPCPCGGYAYMNKDGKLVHISS